MGHKKCMLVGDVEVPYDPPLPPKNVNFREFWPSQINKIYT